MNKIPIFDKVEIEIELPDGVIDTFEFDTPNSDNPHWYKIVETNPSGSNIYKDPLRRNQRSYGYYYPEFHFNYSSHKLFTHHLLNAVNIKLVTGFNSWRVDCLLDNSDAVRNYFSGMALYSDSYVIPNGDLELVLIGRKRETWQEALKYYFYYIPGFTVITFDSTEYTFDSTEVVFY